MMSHWRPTNKPPDGSSGQELERDHAEHAEPLAGAEVNLLRRLDHYRVGRLTEIVRSL